jgi:hypothetical protein
VPTSCGSSLGSSGAEADAAEIVGPETTTVALVVRGELGEADVAVIVAEIDSRSGATGCCCCCCCCGGGVLSGSRRDVVTTGATVALRWVGGGEEEEERGEISWRESDW